jgi:hypothetical protein
VAEVGVGGGGPEPGVDPYEEEPNIRAEQVVDRMPLESGQLLPVETHEVDRELNRRPRAPVYFF